MKKLNEERGKLGLGPFDPQPAANKLMNTFKNAVKNSKNPMLQASLSGDNLAKAKPEDDKNEKDLLEKLKQKKKGGVEETAKTEDFMSGLKFDFKQEKSNSNLDFDLEEEANRVSDLDVKMDDVTTSSSTNIFKVISIRYLKSAFPILLEEEK